MPRTRKFQELRDQMTPERRARNDAAIKQALSSAIGSDLKRVRAMRDEEINYTDLPDLSGEDWTHARAMKQTHADAAGDVRDEAGRHNVPNLEALRDVRERCPDCVREYQQIKRSKFTIDERAPLTSIALIQFDSNPRVVLGLFQCGAHSYWEVEYCVTGETR